MVATTDRLAADGRRCGRRVFAGCLAFEMPGGSSEEPDVVDAAGTSIRLPIGPASGLAHFLGDQFVSMLGHEFASLARTVLRSSGVAVDQSRNAARADATATSTSAGVARAISAMTLPLAD